MTRSFSFARMDAELNRAASAGVIEAAQAFAQVLRAEGERVSVQNAPDGTARVVIEGAAAVQREFGAQASPARPFAGPALRASRAAIGEIIARKLAEALRG